MTAQDIFFGFSPAYFLTELLDEIRSTCWKKPGILLRHVIDGLLLVGLLFEHRRLIAPVTLVGSRSATLFVNAAVAQNEAREVKRQNTGPKKRKVDTRKIPPDGLRSPTPDALQR